MAIAEPRSVDSMVNSLDVNSVPRLTTGNLGQFLNGNGIAADLVSYQAVDGTLYLLHRNHNEKSAKPVIRLYVVKKKDIGQINGRPKLIMPEPSREQALLELLKSYPTQLANTHRYL